MPVLKKIVLGLLGIWLLSSVVGTEAFRTASSQKQTLTLLDAAPDWSGAGEFIKDQYGSAFAAGDINGDGYADIVVGSPGYNAGQSQGKVYVYDGNPLKLIDSTPSCILTGDASYAYFGSSITSADINGDGYADVIVGEYGYANPTGRVYVFPGSSAGLVTTPTLTLTSQTRNDEFGFSVAGVGDVNGDGYADFMVGAPRYNDSSGRAYLYLGNSNPGITLNTVFTFTGQAGAFGQWVAPAGDVNGDGLADVTISAPEYNSRQGQVFLYQGTSLGLSATPVLTLTGEAQDNYFGQSGGTVGDVNGDGYADLIIGASGYMTNIGRAYLYLGSSAGLSAAPALTLTGQNAGDNFGRSVAMAGDVNGDGYADVIVGAPGYDSNLGRAYFYLGSQAGLSATPVLTLTGKTDFGRFGGSVGGAGDANGDGYAELAIGSPGVVGKGSSQGAISVYHGSSFLPSATPQRVLTGEEGDQLGGAVATAGDANGDGYADVIVGARGAVSGRGQAYLYLGSNAGLSDTPAKTLTGENPADLFGASVAGAGDINGDGYADAIIGAEGYDSGRGRVYVYPGSSDGLQATAAVTLTGQNPGDLFGASVGTAGDVNGDGYADFIVGAPGANRAFIYYGGAKLSATPSMTLTGENSGDMFGGSVAAAGDVNGDGYADVIVGAKAYGGLQGRAYVYLGQSAGLGATPALTLTSLGDQLGAAVGTAGDVNGDGYADIVVGAPRAGRVYIYSGGSNLSDVPIFTLTGGSSGDDFGVSADTAGDVNGDGFSDIIVGADADSSNQGRAYLYLGGPLGLGTTPALTLTGESANAGFGSVAGTAGDVDGDGFADLVVGAAGFGKSQGRAYLHLGNGGGGKDALPRAQRPKDGLLIQPWDLSQTPYGFEVSLAAVDPMGRGRVKLQTQICLPGEAFSDLNCPPRTSPDWIDVAVSPTVTLTITDLDPNTLYRWRARVLYAPFSVTSASEPPNPAHGPWRRFLAQSQEADVKTARLYWIYLPLVDRSARR